MAPDWVQARRFWNWVTTPSLFQSDNSTVAPRGVPQIRMDIGKRRIYTTARISLSIHCSKRPDSTGSTQGSGWPKPNQSSMLSKCSPASPYHRYSPPRLLLPGTANRPQNLQPRWDPNWDHQTRHPLFPNQKSTQLVIKRDADEEMYVPGWYVLRGDR